MIAIRSILFATDFSECSERALHYALALAHQHGARLTVAHVVQVPDPYGPYEAWAFNRAAVEKELADESIKHIEEALEGKVPDGVQVEPRAIAGIPSRAIVALAEDERFDLVVVGTHGRSGLGHLVMGSVAERIVRGSPCPTLTVPPGAREPDDG